MMCKPPLQIGLGPLTYKLQGKGKAGPWAEHDQGKNWRETKQETREKEEKPDDVNGLRSGC